MGRAAVSLEEAQSFDRVADSYDRLRELSANELIGSWLESVLPAEELERIVGDYKKLAAQDRETLLRLAGHHTGRTQ